MFTAPNIKFQESYTEPVVITDDGNGWEGTMVGVTYNLVLKPGDVTINIICGSWDIGSTIIGTISEPVNDKVLVKEVRNIGNNVPRDTEDPFVGAEYLYNVLILELCNDYFSNPEYKRLPHVEDVLPTITNLRT
jgi:hypothetical protein